MAYFTPGTPAVASTQAIAANPSTSTLIAEIDSTALSNHIVSQNGGNFMVTWILGGSTLSFWQCEAATSTALGASVNTPACPVLWPMTATNQSAQFMTKMRLERGHRLRARVQTALGAANMSATIIAEPLD